MMKISKLIAILSITTGATAVFSHNSSVPSAASTERVQTAWGIAGNAKAVNRTITVTMTDQMRFTPAELQVRVGDTVRLVVRNAGKGLHELVIGTRAELDAHAALMLKFPGMEHNEPYMAHVDPGKTSQLIWTFNRVGDFEFACLLPGHYQAGMVGKIKVMARSTTAP
ncbi:MAG: hypothetical protein RIS90_1481 [Pseudomonadota bacterium]|jgi:uncharacterized cupredoxin-like copper-binding protein